MKRVERQYPEISIGDAKAFAENNPELIRIARLQVAEEAGHSKISITNAYCGSFRIYTRRQKLTDALPYRKVDRDLKE